MLAQPSLWVIMLAFLCVIGPLVFFHELGHYWVARWFGVGAESFSIGFGREIAGWTDKRGTRWKIGWLPLGGYVKFVGDADAASRPGEGGAADPAAFHTRPWWQRFLVVLAGPVANFILAIALLFGLYLGYRVAVSPPVAVSIVQGSAAERAGLKPGDRLVEVAGESVDNFQDMVAIVAIRPGGDVSLKYQRGNDVLATRVRLGERVIVDPFGQKTTIGLLGVNGAEPVVRSLSIGEAATSAVRTTFQTTRMIVVIVGQIMTGDRSAKELGGPLKMAQAAGQQASLGLSTFVWLAAMISINLGFINLLPIPMLDGGHLVFYAAEGVSRKPVSEKAQDWAFRGGLALLFALLIFTTVNDLASFGLFERLGRLIG